MRRVVPPREGAIARQLGLHLIEMRLADESGHLSDKQPRRSGQRGGRTMRAADGVRRRAPVRRGTIARALGIDLPRVGRIAQNPADRRA